MSKPENASCPKGTPSSASSASSTSPPTDLDELDDACADVEQAAAQSLLDLRPLDARHDLGWVASLPLGRGLARTLA